MAEPIDVQHLVAQLMIGASPKEGSALIEALLSGQVSSILDKLAADEKPVLRPVPTKVRGFRVRLDLRGAKPPVWRRLELAGDLTLPRVHEVIQAAMGWYDCHLHRFRTGGYHGSPHFVTSFDLDEGADGVLEDGVRLDQLLAEKGDRLWYEYDFGDGWDHRLVVEELLDEPPPTARCIAGRMACPPEDCGGLGGYWELAEWVRSGYDDALLPGVFDNAAQAQEWLPLNWHPDRFDVEETNAALTVATAEPVAVTGGLAELVGELELRGNRLLREVLGRPLSHESTEVAEAEASRLTETYRVFLDVIGDGVTLTGAGYLPPAVVERFAVRSGITEWWIGKANREDLTHPVAEVRNTARALGLVNIRKGRLSPTATAIRTHQDPSGLWRHIVSRLPLGVKDSDRQAGWLALAVVGSGAPAERWRPEISELLFALGWRSGHDRYPAPPADSPTLDVLKHLAGFARNGWGPTSGIDLAVSATARAAVRHG